MRFFLSLTLGMLLLGATALSAYAESGPAVVHPKPGTQWIGDGIKVTFQTRKQHYSFAETETLDKDIHSPKSVNIHPSGRKYYVNSLEGAKTVVYDFYSGEKLKVIRHHFDDSSKDLWAPSSGLYS